jgi:hypothetical protein
VGQETEKLLGSLFYAELAQKENQEVAYCEIDIITGN